MQGMSRLRFPEGSLLVAMLGEHAPLDARRGAACGGRARLGDRRRYC
jgi:hypothetical protein